MSELDIVVMSSNETVPIREEATKELRVYNSFDDMKLSDNLLRGVYAYGFERPSEIQKRGIMPIVEGRDVLGQAQSGTGKTGTFTIGSLTRIDPSLQQVQVIVLAPVRELAQQIETVAKGISEYLGIKVYTATGGTPVRDDIQALRKGCHFLVGTPGRIYDLASRKALSFSNVRVLVIDEADQMLEDRFQDQIMEILKIGFPQITRVALFSATMPPEVVQFTDSILNNPVRILMPPQEVPLDGIVQYYVDLEKEEWKFDVLCDIYSQLAINQAMIYCNKRQRAEWLANKMKDAKFTLEYIHGEMDVAERKKRMDDFRKGNVRVLISTDMLARGIDVQQVSLVINFELPTDTSNYIHRIGRAGRYGRKGTTINLISKDEKKYLEEIQKTYPTLNMTSLPENLSLLNL